MADNITQGDVLLFQTNDGGEIVINNGLTTLSNGIETATYLSMFGGNEDDDNSQDNKFSWWGNLSENDPAKQYRSETQNLLQSIPAIPANLRRVEDAIKRDLAWFLTEGVASEITAVATLPAVNTINIKITMTTENELYNFNFNEVWPGIS